MLPFLIGNIQRICYFLEEAVNPSPNISFLQALIPKGERHEEYLRSRLMDEYPFVHLMNKVVALTEGQEVTQNKRELLLALYHELEEISKNDIVPKAYMRKLKEAIQRVPVPTGELAPAMKLHQQLVSVGAYERLRQLDPKRATLLQTYLTTEKSAAEAGKEVGIQSRTRAHELLHSSMEVAFFALPEEDRLRFDNNPATALRTRAAQQTTTKSQKIKEAHSKRPKDPETGKIAFSETHKQHITEGNKRRWQRNREEEY